MLLDGGRSFERGGGISGRIQGPNQRPVNALRATISEVDDSQYPLVLQEFYNRVRRTPLQSWEIIMSKRGKSSDQTYTISTYRIEENGVEVEKLSARPDDMSKEDIVTRFLYWLGDTIINFQTRMLETSPVVMGIQGQLDELYEDIRASGDRYREAYPEHWADARREEIRQIAWALTPDELAAKYAKVDRMVEEAKERAAKKQSK